VTAPRHVLVDTSVFIALESGRPITSPGWLRSTGSSLSVVTLAELRSGVLAAHDTETRTQRLATLEGVSDIDVLPIDEPVAHEWARLRMFLWERGRRMNVNDLWIASTAAARGIPVVTQDADFDALDGASGCEVIRV
jgi:predicted nucleic acid-binding protein